MEKSDILPLIWLFLAYGIMAFARIALPEPLAGYVGMSGLLLMVVMLVIQDAYSRVKISKYAHLDAWIRPRWQRKHIYYVNFESKQIGPNRYVTTLYLGFPLRHKEYGKVDRIYITHNLPWKVRIKLREGKAVYAGLSVEHAQTDHVVLYEYSTPRIDHAKPYPVYELVEAGGDYPYFATVVREAYASTPELAPQMPKMDGGLVMEEDELRKLKEDQLRAEIVELREKQIRLEEMLAATRDELVGLLKSRPNISRMVKEHVLAISEEQAGIERAIRMIGRPKIPWNLIGALAIIFGIITMLTIRPEILAGINVFLANPNNQMFVIIFLLIVGGIVYYLQKRRGRETR